MKPTQEFLDAAAQLGIAFEQDDLDQLGQFLAMLLDANTRFNLTSITEPGQAWMRHIFDALTLLPHLVSAEASTVMDIGSGGGVPGLPLAVVLPNVQFTLVESTGKKAAFLRETAAQLNLSNVTVLSDRAESLGQDREHREHYDVVTARAVGRLNVLLELTVPLARVGGYVLAIKGERASEEIAEAKQALHHLHCTVMDTSRTLTGTIVTIEKLRKTPRLYPRKPGEPKRAPLK
jgi:16S rRNA (guanine527-N7)-methyltransferase